MLNKSTLLSLIFASTLIACGGPASTKQTLLDQTSVSLVDKTPIISQDNVSYPVPNVISSEPEPKAPTLKQAKPTQQVQVTQPAKKKRKSSPTAHDLAIAKRLASLKPPLPNKLLGFWDGHGALLEGGAVIPNVLGDKSLVLRRSEKNKGSIPVTPKGLILPSLDPDFDSLELNLFGRHITELSFGGFAELTKETAGDNKFAHLIGVAPNADRSVNNQKGQLGISGKSQSFRIFNNPDLTNARSRATATLNNQGLVHIAVTIKQSKMTGYINGVPVFEGPARNFAPFSLDKLTLLGASYTLRAPTKSNQHREYADMFWVSGSALTSDEISQIDAYARARFAIKQVNNVPRKIAVIACCDSLTAFLPSPFWRLNESPELKPGFLGVLEAWGGSKFGSLNANAYDNENRRRLRIDMAVSALKADYQNVVLSWQYGTNDLLGIMRSTKNPIGWRSGRMTIDEMIQQDKASILSHPDAKADWGDRLKLVLVTIPPHGRWESAKNKNFQASKMARLAYNRDCREKYRARGYDALIDLASYKPKGFDSFEHAALDAALNGENSVFLKDGIHYSQSGGQDISDNVFLPFYLSLKRSLSAGTNSRP